MNKATIVGIVLVIIIVFIVVFILFVGQSDKSQNVFSNQATPNEGFELYTDDQTNYMFSYPKELTPQSSKPSPNDPDHVILSSTTNLDSYFNRTEGIFTIGVWSVPTVADQALYQKYPADEANRRARDSFITSSETTDTTINGTPVLRTKISKVEVYHTFFTEHFMTTIAVYAPKEHDADRAGDIIQSFRAPTIRPQYSWRSSEHDGRIEDCFDVTYVGRETLQGWFEELETNRGDQIAFHVDPTDQLKTPLGWISSLDQRLIIENPDTLPTGALSQSSEKNTSTIIIDAITLHCQDLPSARVL